MDTLLTVIILGLSLEGLVLCPFLAFGLSLTEKRAGLRFLLGRLIGLICFGIVISLLGNGMHFDERVTNLIFGLLIISLGLWRAVSLDETKPGWKTSTLRRSLAVLNGHGNGKGKKNYAGFVLGLFRGLCNPGRKYLYLAPFLLDVGVYKGLALSFAYGVSSSVYLLLGFLSAGFVNMLAPHKRRLSVLGGLLLVVVGGYYVWKSYVLLV